MPVDGRMHARLGGVAIAGRCGLAAEAGFAERAGGPTRTACRYYPVELRERDAVVGRLDEPPVADVDRHVVDLGRARASGRAAPKKMTSAGCRCAKLISSERGTSPLMTYVVRPRRTEARSALARVARQLVHAPHESGAVVAAARGDAEVDLVRRRSSRPTRTASRCARPRCRGSAAATSSTCGSENVSARFWTIGTSQPDEWMICAAEYAASARVAGSSGSSSSDVLARGMVDAQARAGAPPPRCRSATGRSALPRALRARTRSRLRRGRRRRRAPRRASPSSPRAAPCGTFGGCAGGVGAGGGGSGSVTVVVVVGSVVVGVGSVAVGSVVVGSVVVCVGSVTVGSGCGGVGATGGGGGGGGASSCFRSNTRFASAWFVSVAFGRNVAGDFVPIRPHVRHDADLRQRPRARMARRWRCAVAAGRQHERGDGNSYATTPSATPSSQTLYPGIRGNRDHAGAERGRTGRHSRCFGGSRRETCPGALAGRGDRHSVTRALAGPFSHHGRRVHPLQHERPPWTSSATAATATGRCGPRSRRASTSSANTCAAGPLRGLVPGPRARHALTRGRNSAGALRA